MESPIQQPKSSYDTTITSPTMSNSVKNVSFIDANNNNNNNYKSNLEIEKVEKRNQFLEKELDYVKSELQSTRRILTERDDLLLQLQWDESDEEIDYEGQKKKKKYKSKEKVLTEERRKIERLRSQMRLMENALSEKELNINRLTKEINDIKIIHQQQIDMLRAPREAPQRSKTSWGFRSSPSSSPLAFKPSPNSSPAIMDTSRMNGKSPSSSPMVATPNYISSPASTSAMSSLASTTSSPAMDSHDFKKVHKKPSFFTFKRDKKKSHPNIQDTNWAQTAN